MPLRLENRRSDGILQGRGVRGVDPPAVEEDIRHARLRGGFDELGLRVGGRRDGQGDDEDLLACQGRDERGVVIGCFGDLYALGEGGSAGGAGEGRYFVLSCPEELGGDVFAYVSGGLLWLVARTFLGLVGTYADDGDFGYVRHDEYVWAGIRGDLRCESLPSYSESADNLSVQSLSRPSHGRHFILQTSRSSSYFFPRLRSLPDIRTLQTTRISPKTPGHV